MLTVIIGMVVALVLAAVVLALVAVPARREGRDVLTSQGEQLVSHALERTADAVGAARERTADAVGAARERVGELAERLPVSRSEPAGQAGQAEAASEVIDLRDVPTPTPARDVSRSRSDRR